jgi:hypothetical protein
MLFENFSIKISADELVGLPIVNEAVKPFPQELPMFILRLALVDYTDDTQAIHAVAEELSFFYARYVDMLTLQ